tara:strand:+ start:932 stop:1159 length:228 start_codon:yes stop_codon:yes gene_type:complete
MTKKKSHEENVRYIYQFYKDTGQHDKAREYKQEQKNLARMFGRKDPFGPGCLIPIIVILSSFMSFIYFSFLLLFA